MIIFLKNASESLTAILQSAINLYFFVRGKRKRYQISPDREYLPGEEKQKKMQWKSLKYWQENLRLIVVTGTGS